MPKPFHGFFRRQDDPNVWDAVEGFVEACDYCANRSRKQAEAALIGHFYGDAPLRGDASREAALEHWRRAGNRIVWHDAYEAFEEARRQGANLGAAFKAAYKTAIPPRYERFIRGAEAAMPRVLHLGNGYLRGWFEIEGLSAFDIERMRESPNGWLGIDAEKWHKRFKPLVPAMWLIDCFTLPPNADFAASVFERRDVMAFLAVDPRTDACPIWLYEATTDRVYLLCTGIDAFLNGEVGPREPGHSHAAAGAPYASFGWVDGPPSGDHPHQLRA